MHALYILHHSDICQIYIYTSYWSFPVATGRVYVTEEKARTADSPLREIQRGQWIWSGKRCVLSVAELVGATAVGNYAAATSRPPLEPKAAATAASAPSSSSSSLSYFSRRPPLYHLVVAPRWNHTLANPLATYVALYTLKGFPDHQCRRWQITNLIEK